MNANKDKSLGLTYKHTRLKELKSANQNKETAEQNKSTNNRCYKNKETKENFMDFRKIVPENLCIQCVESIVFLYFEAQKTDES